ncbi:protein BIG GRAIN 1-like B [Salvia hispanica]|uniref:protein BIG GRAIN 1-like B n=1 Tax=Salvia hispanica TaxID=49212 RepID=UPI0020093291|nr:protein BIG GRAIN 1-like B [Salvia hispanica]
MYSREKLCRNQTQKSRKNDKNPPSFSSTLLDEIYRSIDANADNREAARTSLVEKWMEKERAAAAMRRKNQEHVHENDVVFFSSTSSSSDSSGALSSSDTEFFASATRSKAKLSCFTTRPKPVRTGPAEDDLIKSKSRALKIYANLKKVKQPISPGGRLTTFINSLFSNASGKKIESRDDKSLSSSTACSSASSYSRSCLSKYSPREKTRDGERRRVRFEPVNEEVVDRHKNLGSGDSGRFGRPPLPPIELKVGKKAEFIAKRQNTKRVDVLCTDDEEDCLSDSSSDLFELDHLAFFGSNRYSEELPVYETTHFDTNCAIASRLSR